MGVISESHGEPVTPQIPVEKSLRLSGLGAAAQRSDAPIRPPCASRQKQQFAGGSAGLDRTSSENPTVSETITASAPADFAAATFSSLDTRPMTRPPRSLTIWVRRRP